jgi:hypothetical protein
MRKLGVRTLKKEIKQRHVVNMNYPAKDMSMKELERFWGEPREEDRNLLDNIKVKEKRKIKPSPV